MVSRLISISVIGILILLIIGAIWQVAPVSAGITPTPTPTATPTATPTTTPIPPTTTPIPPAPPAETTPIPPTETTPMPTATPYPLLPHTGEQANAPSNRELIIVVLAGVLLLLLAGLRLVIRRTA